MNLREQHLAERFWARMACTCGSSIIFLAKDQSVLDEWMGSFQRVHDHPGHEVSKEVKTPSLAQATILEVQSP